MRIETLQFTNQAGWSRPFPDLDSTQTLVLLFGGGNALADPAAVMELCEAFPTSKVIGCSSAGEIFGGRVFDDSLSVAVMRFDHARVATTCTPISDEPDASYQAGMRIAQELEGAELRAVFVLSDGLMVNGTRLVRALNDHLAEEVVVTGGLAGDGDRFESTWVVHDGRPASGAVSAVGLYGDRLRVGHGSKGGWDAFGLVRQVTRSEDNVLFELDGKPALQLYKQYLGDRASGLPAAGLLFPLAIRDTVDSKKSLVRTILAVDEDEQSMTFAGDIPLGAQAQLMKANFERLVGGAFHAAEQAAQPDVEGDTLAIAISCVGRRLVLGERTEEEVEATLDVLPAGTQQVGFYSYGEISPFASGDCDLHNQTMTLTTLAEV